METATRQKGKHWAGSGVSQALLAPSLAWRSRVFGEAAKRRIKEQRHCLTYANTLSERLETEEEEAGAEELLEKEVNCLSRGMKKGRQDQEEDMRSDSEH